MEVQASHTDRWWLTGISTRSLLPVSNRASRPTTSSIADKKKLDGFCGLWAGSRVCVVGALWQLDRGVGGPRGGSMSLFVASVAKGGLYGLVRAQGGLFEL